MRSAIFLFLVPFFAACTVESPAPTGDGESRGSLGKADLVGSCEKGGQDLCGGPGAGNCWCDELCVDFGDCCGDVEEVCGIEPPEPEGQPCGGLLGLQCEEGEFCAFPPEAMCGAGDQLGECAWQPEACTQIYAPVCGCDGQTYGNGCMAASAGVSIVGEGECADEGDVCGAIEDAYAQELAEIRACQSDDQCGQELVGTSCGCTRNLVARLDANLKTFETLRSEAQENQCEIGGISTCDCPPAEGFACNAGVCSWNYL